MFLVTVTATSPLLSPQSQYSTQLLTSLRNRLKMHMMALNSMVLLLVLNIRMLGWYWFLDVLCHLVGNLEERMITSRRMLITLIAKQRNTESSLSW